MHRSLLTCCHLRRRSLRPGRFSLLNRSLPLLRPSRRRSFLGRPSPSLFSPSRLSRSPNLSLGPSSPTFWSRLPRSVRPRAPSLQRSTTTPAPTPVAVGFAAVSMPAATRCRMPPIIPTCPRIRERLARWRLWRVRSRGERQEPPCSPEACSVASLSSTRPPRWVTSCFKYRKRKFEYGYKYHPLPYNWHDDKVLAFCIL